MRIKTFFYLVAIVQSCEDLKPDDKRIASGVSVVNTGTVLEFACHMGITYGYRSNHKYPSYNNGTLLNQVKCVGNKWKWPTGFDKVKCALVSCPPVPKFPSISQMCVMGTDKECFEECYEECFHSWYAFGNVRKQPALSLKEVDSEYDDIKVTFSSLRCLREGSTEYGQWRLNGVPDLNPKWLNSYVVTSNSPVKCVDYYGCPLFMPKVKAKVNQTCINSGHGHNDNCDTIIFDCPKGKKPSVSSVTCKRKTDCGYENCLGGKWEFSSSNSHEKLDRKPKIRCIKQQ